LTKTLTKDRVKKVKKKFDTILNNTFKQLSNNERNDVQKCVIWAIESVELDEIISAQKKLDILNQTKEKFKVLERKYNQNTIPSITAIVVSIIFFPLFGCILGSITGEIDYIPQWISQFLPICLIGLSAIVIIISIINLSRVDKKEYIELRNQRGALIRQLPSKERLQYLRNKFGKLTYKEYESITEERKLKCTRFVEYDKNGNLLEEPLDKIIARLQ